MKFHILTAVTRPAHLSRIGEALATAPATVEITWHLRLDPRREHVGGQRLKNDLIDQIADGWLWICDDDNLPHPDLFTLVPAIAADPSVGLIVVSQELPDGTIRRAEDGCLKVNAVDAAQLIIRRDVLGDLRLLEVYAGDGLLAEALAAAVPAEAIRYLWEPAAYYNALREG